MPASRDIYAGQDPRDVAAYPVPQAALLVGVPTSTLRAWVFGRRYPVSSGTRRQQPVIVAPQPGYLSFTNLVEAHVLAAMRREHQLKLATVRNAVRYVERELGVPHPLARSEFKTDGIDVFLDHLGSLISVSRDGQLAIREAMSLRLTRIEYDRKRAVRLFPLQRPEQPKVIVIDPRRAFGQPVLTGTGVPAAVINERFRAGDSIQHLAEEYGVGAELIEEALRAA